MTKAESIRLLCLALNALSEINSRIDISESSEAQKIQNEINAVTYELPGILRQDFYDNTTFTEKRLLSAPRETREPACA